MTWLQAITQSASVTNLGWAMLHFIWEGLAISLALRLALSVLRKGGPQARYLAACGAMGLLAVAPALTYWLMPRPTLPGNVLRQARIESPSTLQPGSAWAEGRTTALALIEHVTSRSAQLSQDAASPPDPVGRRKAPSGSLAQRVAAALSRVAPWLIFPWAAGVVLLSIRNLGSWVAVRNLRALTACSVSQPVEQMAAALCARLGIGRAVSVFQSTRVDSPLVFGFLKPVILLPVSVLTELPPAQIEALLAHELAHVLRHDYLVNLLQCAIETLLFYHPAVWWVSRQLRIEREHCCDDLVVSITQKRETYARALAAVADVRLTNLVPAASGGGVLLPRLRRILGIPAPDVARSSFWLTGAITLAACLLVVASIGPNLIANAGTDPVNDAVHVKGRVLDPSGRPVSGAKVFAAPDWPNGLAGDLPAVVADATTGADGRFDISFNGSAVSRFSPRDGDAGTDLWKKTQIAARADGYGMDWQRFHHVDPATGDLVLRLVPDLPLKGRIVDPEGRPAPGVVVKVSGLVDDVLAWQSQGKHPSADSRDIALRGIAAPLAATGRNDPIVSDADGRFEITGLGRDRLVTLNFSSEKFTLPPWQRVCTREQKVDFDLLGSKEHDAHFDIPGNTFELTASPARSLVGVVRDAQTHKPLRNVRVYTSYARLQASTMTDEQGGYRLAPLERGQHIEITADSKDEPYVPAIFDLPTKPTAEPLVRDIDMIRGVWITGKVVDAKTGAPIAASVNFQPLASNKAAAAIPLFHLGYAQCPCNAQTAPDGTYRLVGVSGPAVVALMLRGNPDYYRGQGFDSIRSRDRAGRVASMFPGIVNPAIYYAAREIIVAPDPVTPGIDFQLQRGDTIRVTCTGPEGTPIRKLSVSGNTTALSRNATLIEGVQFDAVGLVPGETRLVTVRDDEHHLGKVVRIRAVDARDRKLTVTLEPMGTVTGRLLTPRQEPIAAGLLRVGIAVRDPHRTNHVDDVTGYAGPDGRFKLELPVGCPYILGASASPYGERMRFYEQNLIDLTPGGTKDMGDLQPDAKPVKH